MTDRVLDVAVIGADGILGEAILSFLAESEIPVGNLRLPVGADAAGGRVEFKGRRIVLEDLDGFDFGDVELAIFAAGEAASAEHGPEAVAGGCVVIDTSGCFSREQDVPLVVAAVNPEAVAGFRPRGIVACPTGPVTALATALKPVLDAAGIERVNIATYQSVSQAGRAGVEELATQTAQLLNLRSIKPDRFPRQIAFNVLGQIGSVDASGYSAEEMKLIRETQKVLGDDSILLNPTAALVPVFFGDSIAVHLQGRKRIGAEQAGALFGQAGMVVMNSKAVEGFPTAVEAAQQDALYVGRLREDLSHPHGLDFWLVTDSVRLCARNCVQTAQILVKDFL